MKTRRAFSRLIFTRWIPISLLLLVFSSSRQVAQGSTGQVEITPIPATRVAAGNYATWSYHIQNLAPERTSIRASIHPPSEWSAVSTERGFELEPEETVTVPFTVWIPGHASADSLYRVIIEVSTEAGTVVASTNRKVQIAGNEDFVISAATPSLPAEPGERVSHLFKVENTGNTTLTLDLSVTTIPSWPARVPTPTITIAAGETKDISVTLTIPPSAEGGTLHHLTLVATSRRAHSPTTPPKWTSRRVTTIVQAPVIGAKRHDRLPATLILSTDKVPQTGPIYGLRAFSHGAVSEKTQMRFEADVVSHEVVEGDRDWERRRLRLQLYGDNWEGGVGDVHTQFPDVATRTLWGQGVSFRSTGNRWSARLLACPDWISGNREPNAYSAWGVGIGGLLREWAWVEADAIHTKLHTKAAERKQDFVCLTAHHERGPGLQLRLEAAHSSSDDELGHITGTGAHMIAVYQRTSLRVRGRCYTGSDGYRGTNGPRDGIIAYVRYYPGRHLGTRLDAPRIALWMSLDSSNGPSGVGAGSPLFLTTRYRLGGRYSRPAWPTLELTVGGGLDREGDGGSMLNLEKREMSLAIWRMLGRLLVSVSGRWGKAYNRLADQDGDAMGAGVSLGGPVAGLSTTLRWSRDRDEIPDWRFRIDSSTLSSDLRWTTAAGRLQLGLGASSRWYKSRAAGDAERTENRLMPRIDWHVHSGLRLTTEAWLWGVDGPLGVDRWRIELAWNSVQAVPKFWGPDKGGVHTVVFLDDDLDGRPDASERRVAGVSFLLDGSQHLSGEDGTIEYNELPSGSYRIELNPHTVPSDLMPAEALAQDIQVESGEVITVYIPLVQSCELSGVVFHDEDYDTEPDPDEDGLGDIRIELLRDGEKVGERLTGRKGGYRFRRIPPGEYVVAIVQDWLPSGWTATGKSRFRVIVERGDKTRVGEFGVAPRRKPILRTSSGARPLQDRSSEDGRQAKPIH